ncbi:MAG: DUF6512 family protein [Eubacteriales bacterium]|nr:DUF6512 family protein [Eubacteriales bacterium]
MKKEVRMFLIAGFVFTCIAGTVLHFVYDWSGQNPVAGLFAPINESVWEHLKLLFFPAAIWAVLGKLFIKDREPGILAACTAGILAGLLFIVSFFYTYSGILGTNWLPLDLLTFFGGVLTAFLTAGKRLNKRANGKRARDKTALFFLLLFAFVFFLFTYWPPPLGVFVDYSLLKTGCVICPNLLKS